MTRRVGGAARAQGLALVGPRGTGKTSVGRVVAERLGRPFVDTDQEVETFFANTIAEIFVRLGEPRFRALEAQILAEAVKVPGRVLATGGGIVLAAENRRALSGYGLVVWLTADPAVLAARLAADAEALAARPSLTPAGTLAEIAQVLAARTPLYREVADAIVDTSGKSPAEVADAVLDAWRCAGEPGG